MPDSTNSSLGHLHAGPTLESPDQARYQVQISAAPAAPAWDSFLAATPGGQYVQTSLWGQVKALLGWRAARVVVSQSDRIVAGAQVLLRPLPLVGAIGHVPKGPVLAFDDPRLTQLVLEALHHLARAHRLQYLVVQPPRPYAALAQQLPRWGFRPSATHLLSPATLLLDLTQDLDDILTQMKKKTRYSIRHGLREGITVREGTERDLPTFYRLLVATSQRQHFAVHPEAYYARMWQVLGPPGYLKLLLAEYRGEAVAAVLLIPFGRTVVFAKGGWSGQYRQYCPNNVLHWTAIRWAKAQGYHHYDFGSLRPSTVRAMEAGAVHRDSQTYPVDAFKLGFGGQVTRFPAPADCITNPVLRWAYTTVFPKLAHRPLVKKVIHAMRGLRRT